MRLGLREKPESDRNSEKETDMESVNQTDQLAKKGLIETANIQRKFEGKEEEKERNFYEFSSSS